METYIKLDNGEYKAVGNVHLYEYPQYGTKHVDFHVKDHSDIPVEKEYFHTWSELEIAAIEFVARRRLWYKRNDDNWDSRSNINHFMMLKDYIVDKYDIDEFDLMTKVCNIINGDFYKMTSDDCVKEWKECVEKRIDKMMDTKDWEIENMVERVKELVDSIEPFNSPPSQEIIDKINAIGCTSFLFKDCKVYMIGNGGKPVKFVVEQDGDEV